MKKKEWTKIGEAAVDSGQLLITDPCYINSEWDNDNKALDFNDKKQIGKYSYNGCCMSSLNMFENKKLKKDSGQLKFKKGHAGAGVVFGSGYGDGVYNVYARIENGVIEEIRIKL